MTFTCNCTGIYNNIVCTRIYTSWDELCPVMDMCVLACAPGDRDSKIIWSVRDHLCKRKEIFSCRIEEFTPPCPKAQVFKVQPRFSLKIGKGSAVIRSALRTSIWHCHQVWYVQHSLPSRYLCAWPAHDWMLIFILWRSDLLIDARIHREI